MKKVLTLVAALTLALGSATSAQARDNSYGGYKGYNSYGGSTYDRSSGNSYRSYGNGSYSGSNAGTGSNWGATTQGSTTRGTDSKGNAWSYDRNTGNYYNYGTGESRQKGRRW